LLGVEQLLLPFFLGWEAIRYLIRSKGRFTIKAPFVWALLLAVWWVVPIIWVDREFLDIFLKETATAWSQALCLFLFYNALRTQKDWWLVVRALEIVSLYLVVGGLLFLSGLWRGELLSVFGRLLPTSLVESSAFFDSIAYRAFGTAGIETGILSQRVSSFSLNFSGLSIVCLLLLPFMVWRFQTTLGFVRFRSAFLIIGLFICLVFAESRIAYLAFIVGIGLFLLLRLDLFRGDNRFLLAAMVCVGAVFIIAFSYLAIQVISEAVQTVFLELRPESWLARLSIYSGTIRLFPEHPIAGWGAPVRREGSASTYSIGTHSSYLGMLFQHGIVGLLFYLTLWLSIWRVVIRSLREAVWSPAMRLFWIMMAVAFFTFNIREAADSWWWDQLTVFTIWLIWGLVLTAPRVLTNRGVLSNGTVRQ
jgi:O-antigen ligase